MAGWYQRYVELFGFLPQIDFVSVADGYSYPDVVWKININCTVGCNSNVPDGE